MNNFLNQESFRGKSRKERLRIDRLEDDLAEIWSDAVEEVALERAEKQHPGYGKKNPLPVLWERSYYKVLRELNAEIYGTIWRNSPAWTKVESDFKAVKAAYLQSLKEMPNLPEDVRRDWLERVETIQLTIPGTDPDADDQHSCSTSQMNAYYMPRTHRLTVCAGYFNTAEVAATLGHEIAHGLGISRSTDVFKQRSGIAQKLKALRRQVCSQSPIQSCPADWARLKANFEKELKDLEGFKPQVPEFLSCLQYKPSFESPSASTLKEISEASARESVAYYSDEDGFLLLTSPKIIHSNGQKEANPDYLNPCATREPKDKDFNLEYSVPILIALEYACDQGGGTTAAKIRRAGQSAIRLQAQILSKTLPIGGRFSKNDALAARGYSEDSEERFADAIGNRVLASMLKKLPSIEDRRKVFFANQAKRCSPPSIREEHPEEAQAQKEFSFEPHSQGKQRRIEGMNSAIREALACNKDFDHKDCSL